MDTDRDSPLSVTSSITGILTFVVAIAAALYARASYLRNSNEEYFRVKAALAWYKTESTWLSELHAFSPTPSPSSSFLRATTFDAAADVGDAEALKAQKRRQAQESQRYLFVLEDLERLEQGLLRIVEETEERAARRRSEAETGWGFSWGGGGGRVEEGRWTFVPSGFRGFGSFGTGVAVAWLPVRKKALELVRQRDALTARVQFTQMSMVSSRVRDLQVRVRWMEAVNGEALDRLSAKVDEQREDIRKLHDLVYVLANKAEDHGIDKKSLGDTSRTGSPSASQTSAGDGIHRRRTRSSSPASLQRSRPR